MTPEAEALEPKMEYNNRGNLTGLITVDGEEIMRAGAHHYAIPSRSTSDKHDVYVESLNPTIYRCRCMKFLFGGACHHGERAVRAERVFMKMFPDDYKREKRIQRHPSRKRR